MNFQDLKSSCHQIQIINKKASTLKYTPNMPTQFLKSEESSHFLSLFFLSHFIIIFFILFCLGVCMQWYTELLLRGFREIMWSAGIKLKSQHARPVLTLCTLYTGPALISEVNSLNISQTFPNGKALNNLLFSKERSLKIELAEICGNVQETSEIVGLSLQHYYHYQPHSITINIRTTTINATTITSMPLPYYQQYHHHHCCHH